MVRQKKREPVWLPSLLAHLGEMMNRLHIAQQCCCFLQTDSLSATRILSLAGSPVLIRHGEMMNRLHIV